LQYSDISDVGACKLFSLPRLVRVHLDYSAVGNETAIAVCEKELFDVSLRGTLVSDAGAGYLARNLRGARRLDLSDCRNITKRGIDALCKSIYDAPRSEGERLRRLYGRR
jgi:hypothetical protein